MKLFVPLTLAAFSVAAFSLSPAAEAPDPNTADPYTYSRYGDFKSAKLVSTSTHGYGMYVCEMQMSPSPTVSTFWLYADAPATVYMEDVYQLWRWSEIDFEFVPYTQAPQAQYLTFDWKKDKVSGNTLYGAVPQTSSIYLSLGLDPSTYSSWVKGAERTDSMISQQIMNYASLQQPGGAPTAGTFSLVFGLPGGPVAVTGLSYSASASALQTAINAVISGNPGLTTLFPSGVTVSTTGLPASEWSIIFTGVSLAKSAVPNIYLDTGGLTPAAGCLGAVTASIAGNGEVTGMLVQVFQAKYQPADGQSWLQLLAANTGSATPAAPTPNTFVSATEWKYPISQLMPPSTYPISRMGSLNFWRAPKGISVKPLDFTAQGYGKYDFSAIYDGATPGTTDSSYFTSETLSNETFFWDKLATGKSGYNPYTGIYTYVITWTPTRVAHYLLPMVGRTKAGLPKIDIDGLTPLAVFTPDHYESMSQFGIHGTDPKKSTDGKGGTVPFAYTELAEQIGKVAINVANYVAYSQASLEKNASATPASPGWSGPPPGRAMPDSNAYVRSVGFFELTSTGGDGSKTADYTIAAPAGTNDNFWVDFSDATTWTAGNWQKKITRFFNLQYSNNFTHYTGDSKSNCLYPNLSPANLSLTSVGTGSKATQVLALTAGANNLPTPNKDLTAWKTSPVNPFYQFAVTAPPTESSISPTNQLLRVEVHEKGHPENYWTANSAVLSPTFLFPPTGTDTVDLTVNLWVLNSGTVAKTGPLPAATYTATITLSLAADGTPTYSIPSGGDPNGIISATSGPNMIQLVNPQ